VLEHEDRAPTRIAIELLTPQREARTLYDLIRSRLERATLAAPACAIALVARDLPALRPRHADLFETRRTQALAWPDLAERLRSKLGDESVRRLSPAADHRPEFAWRFEADRAAPLSANARPARAKTKPRARPRASKSAAASASSAPAFATTRAATSAAPLAAPAVSPATTSAPAPAPAPLPASATTSVPAFALAPAFSSRSASVLASGLASASVPTSASGSAPASVLPSTPVSASPSATATAAPFAGAPRALNPADAGSTHTARVRPLWLLHRAQPLAGIAEVLAGPERIESGWWDGDDQRRDYYVVRTRQGQQAWAFLAVGASSSWMLHGWFA
jgi:hypothetical protein